MWGNSGNFSRPTQENCYINNTTHLMGHVFMKIKKYMHDIYFYVFFIILVYYSDMYTIYIHVYANNKTQ